MEDRYKALVLLGAWCGFRLGESLALTRADIDLEDGSVVVNKSAAQLRSGQRIVGRHPRRRPGSEGSTCRHMWCRNCEAHLERFSGPEPTDLVFTGTQGQPVRRSSLYTAWKRVTKELGMPGVRMHDLRHTGATLAAATGASTKELMNRLGHASSDAALRYQHATQDRDAEIARALSDLASKRQDPKGQSA